MEKRKPAPSFVIPKKPRLEVPQPAPVIPEGSSISQATKEQYGQISAQISKKTTGVATCSEDMWKFVTVKGIEMIKNHRLEHKFNAYKKTMGFTEESFGYRVVYGIDEIQSIARDGVSVNSDCFGDIGDPSQGVLVYNSPALANAGNIVFKNKPICMIMFRTVRGKAFEVPMGSGRINPSTKHNCHTPYGTRTNANHNELPAVIKEHRQGAVYHYEYLPDLSGVQKYPSMILPHAVIKFERIDKLRPGSNLAYQGPISFQLFDGFEDSIFINNISLKGLVQRTYQLQTFPFIFYDKEKPPLQLFSLKKDFFAFHELVWLRNSSPGKLLVNESVLIDAPNEKFSVATSYVMAFKGQDIEFLKVLRMHKRFLALIHPPWRIFYIPSGPLASEFGFPFSPNHLHLIVCRDSLHPATRENMFLGNDQRSGFNWAIAENLKNVRAEQRDVTDEGVLREKGAEMEPASQLSQHVVASHSVPLPIHPSLLKAVPPGILRPAGKKAKGVRISFREKISDIREFSIEKEVNEETPAAHAPPQKMMSFDEQRKQEQKRRETNDLFSMAMSHEARKDHKKVAQPDKRELGIPNGPTIPSKQSFDRPAPVNHQNRSSSGSRGSADAGIPRNFPPPMTSRPPGPGPFFTPPPNFNSGPRPLMDLARPPPYIPPLSGPPPTVKPLMAPPIPPPLMSIPPPVNLPPPSFNLPPPGFIPTAAPPKFPAPVPPRHFTTLPPPSIVEPRLLDLRLPGGKQPESVLPPSPANKAPISQKLTTDFSRPPPVVHPLNIPIPPSILPLPSSRPPVPVPPVVEKEEKGEAEMEVDTSFEEQDIVEKEKPKKEAEQKEENRQKAEESKPVEVTTTEPEEKKEKNDILEYVFSQAPQHKPKEAEKPASAMNQFADVFKTLSKNSMEYLRSKAKENSDGKSSKNTVSTSSAAATVADTDLRTQVSLILNSSKPPVSKDASDLGGDDGAGCSQSAQDIDYRTPIRPPAPKDYRNDRHSERGGLPKDIDERLTNIPMPKRLLSAEEIRKRVDQQLQEKMRAKAKKIDETIKNLPEFNSKPAPNNTNESLRPPTFHGSFNSLAGFKITPDGLVRKEPTVAKLEKEKPVEEKVEEEPEQIRSPSPVDNQPYVPNSILNDQKCVIVPTESKKGYETYRGEKSNLPAEKVKSPKKSPKKMRDYDSIRDTSDRHVKNSWNSLMNDREKPKARDEDDRYRAGSSGTSSNSVRDADKPAGIPMRPGQGRGREPPPPDMSRFSRQQGPPPFNGPYNPMPHGYRGGRGMGGNFHHQQQPNGNFHHQPAYQSDYISQLRPVDRNAAIYSIFIDPELSISNTLPADLDTLFRNLLILKSRCEEPRVHATVYVHSQTMKYMLNTRDRDRSKFYHVFERFSSHPYNLVEVLNSHTCDNSPSPRISELVSCITNVNRRIGGEKALFLSQSTRRDSEAGRNLASRNILVLTIRQIRQFLEEVANVDFDGL